MWRGTKGPRRFYLSTVGEEGRLLVVQLYGFRVQLDGLGPVVGQERLVPAILEGRRLLFRGRHFEGWRGWNASPRTRIVWLNGGLGTLDGIVRQSRVVAKLYRVLEGAKFSGTQVW